MGGTSKKRAKEADTDALLMKRDAAKKGKAPKGAVQKKTKAPKESEKSAKKRTKKPGGNHMPPSNSRHYFNPHTRTLGHDILHANFKPAVPPIIRQR